MSETKIGPHEMAVLVLLAGSYRSDINTFSFDSIAEETGLDRRQAKRAARKQAKRGYAELQAYFYDDGILGGKGYCGTRKGYDYWSALRAMEAANG